MKISGIQQINDKNNNTFQSKFSSAANQFIEKGITDLGNSEAEWLFISEYKKIVKNLKKECENIDICKYGVIDFENDRFVYAGYETLEAMNKNCKKCNLELSQNIQNFENEIFRLIDVLFEVKNKMTKFYHDELHHKLLELKSKHKRKTSISCD